MLHEKCMLTFVTRIDLKMDCVNMHVNMCLCYMSACDILQTDMHVTIIDLHIMVTVNMRFFVV